MTAQTAPGWLTAAYATALALHGAVLAGALGLAVYAAARLGTTANAAREGMLLLGAAFVTGLVPAVPSGFAVASWWLCRRRGWRPSTGHMVLTVFAAAALLLVFAWVLLT